MDTDLVDGFYVLKTTTDKLAGMLNGFSPGWEVTQITHIGGRDWVVIARQEFADEEARAQFVESEEIG